MEIHEHVSLGPKTTMRIGGTARYFAILTTTKDVEDVVTFAEEQRLPLVMLGGGSNTIFADGVIEAVVAKVVADAVSIAPPPDPLPQGEGKLIRVEAGKILASLLGELAEQNLDLSPLAGIPGTVGGALFGNAGQGFGGTWISSYVQNVTFYHEKQWRTLLRKECAFAYRESWFKRATSNELDCPAGRQQATPPVIWEASLCVPERPSAEIAAATDVLLRRRMETQPHVKTAGSCFKSLSDGTPAWKLIDAAGLRGCAWNNVRIAEKHANFLVNTGTATFADAVELVEGARTRVGIPLDVEMRFVGKDGRTVL